MTTTVHSFNVDDCVTFPADAPIKPSLIGATFLVTEVPSGRKTCYRIRAEAGGPVYRARPGELVPATEENLKPASSPLRPFVPQEFFAAGEIVTVKSPSGKVSKDQPFIVIKDPGRDKVSIAQLGGDQDRYYRWPKQSVVRRDVAWLTERLVEMA